MKYLSPLVIALGLTASSHAQLSGTVGASSNSVTYGGATFTAYATGTFGSSTVSGPGANQSWTSGTDSGGNVYIDLNAVGQGPATSSATLSLPLSFYLNGSYSGSGGSVPVNFYWDISKEEQSGATAVNHVTGGSASGGGSTTNSSQSASVGVGTSTPADVDYSNEPTGYISGNQWVGANTTWTMSYYIFSISESVNGHLTHPIHINQHDLGEGASSVAWYLNSVHS